MEMTRKAHVSVEIEWTCLDSVSFLSTEYIRADVNTAGVIYLFLKNSYSLCVLRVCTVTFAGLGTLKILIFLSVHAVLCSRIFAPDRVEWRGFRWLELGWSLVGVVFSFLALYN